MDPTTTGFEIDGVLGGTLATVVADAQAHEDAGCGGLWVGELAHDPFLQVLQASHGASRITIGTGIGVAFARTPMTLAYLGWDLQQYLGGRFVLGLGTQVKPHIERRFSMPWSEPARRLRELVLATRAIWQAWQEGERLSFEGEFYRHTLMTPMFTPERSELAPPPIFLAAIGERMAEVVGEVGDGFIAHPFSTSEYLRDVTIPSIRRGTEIAGRDRKAVQVGGKSFVVTGADDEAIDTARRRVRGQIAFYASTPAYRPVLDVHGWGDLQPRLTALSKEGRWDEMGAEISDEVLEAFAAVGSPAEVGATLARRFAGLADRLIVLGAGDQLADVVAAAKAAMA
jgi:probable F420-dependent oxidoreductase